jgi:hypothetical protein
MAEGPRDVQQPDRTWVIAGHPQGKPRGMLDEVIRAFHVDSFSRSRKGPRASLPSGTGIDASNCASNGGRPIRVLSAQAPESTTGRNLSAAPPDRLQRRGSESN